MNVEEPQVTFRESAAVLLFLVAGLGVFIIKLGMAPQVPILLMFAVLLFYGKFRGFSWDRLLGGISKGISPGIIPIFIFLLIGVLVAAWIASGTIPTLMVYGFRLVSAKYFLPAVFLICTLTGIVVGSSFTTVSTMGIAFMGIGAVLGYPLHYVAGAIVSGAFLGNNISPLSDTTNLVAGIGEIDLFSHIANMRYTAIPAACISLLCYGYLGFNCDVTSAVAAGNSFEQVVTANFFVSPVAIIPAVLLLLAAWRRVPAIPSLLGGTFVGLAIREFFGGFMAFEDISAVLLSGYVSQTNSAMVDQLLSRGGLTSMLGAASLIILALALGGILVEMGIIKNVILVLLKVVDSRKTLVFTTALSSIGINLFVGEQYLSMLLPGETFKGLYDELGIERHCLTRTLADAGAAVNSLIPWGVSGTFIAGTLQVEAGAYIMVAFYPLLAPFFTMLLALYTGTQVCNKVKMSSN